MAVGGVAAKVEELRQQLIFAEETNFQLTYAFYFIMEEKLNMCEKIQMAEDISHQMKQWLEKLQTQTEQTLDDMNQMFNETGYLDPTKTIRQVLSLKSKIEEIQDIQHVGELDQVNYDIENNDNETENTSDKDSDVESLERLGVDIALGQATLCKDVKELSAQMALSFSMVNNMTQDQPYSFVKAHYDVTVSELESQIAALQKEKDELTLAFSQVNSQVSRNTISEQRRKRLPELEPQITELKKKIQEQANIIKLKQRTEEETQKLKNDILKMRTQKIIFVGQMRQENKKLKTWLKQKEREVARLKDQDRIGQLQPVGLTESRQHAAPNTLRRRCRCRIGDCKNCVCSKVRTPCTQECGCEASGACKNAKFVKMDDL